MKKILILIFVFILTGCYNYHELNDLAIVKGISIDFINNQYVLNYAIQEYQNNKEEINILEGKGKTITEAISDINLGKKLYLGHINICIIQEYVARHGTIDAIDFFFREPKSKQTFQLLIAKNESAKDILKNLSSNNKLDDLVKNTNNQNNIVNTTLLSFLKNVKDPGIDGIVSGISLIKNEAKIRNIGIFKGDKLIKWQDLDKNIIVLLKQSDNYLLPIECENGNVVFTINDIKLKKEFDLNEKFIFKFKINGKTSIIEMTCNFNLTKEKDIKLLENLLIENLKENLNKTVIEMKKNKIDYLGIGNYIYQNNYHDWNKIKDDYLDKINIEFEILPNLLKDQNTNKGVKYE